MSRVRRSFPPSVTGFAIDACRTKNTKQRDAIFLARATPRPGMAEEPLLRCAMPSLAGWSPACRSDRQQCQSTYRQATHA
eukprot:scaffold4129_cov390-Prasinococcus_capsulatus_cf.AAC.8